MRQTENMPIFNITKKVRRDKPFLFETIRVHLDALQITSRETRAMHSTLESHVAQLKSLFAAEPCGEFTRALQAHNERARPTVDEATQQNIDAIHSYARDLPVRAHALTRPRDTRVDLLLSPGEEEEVGK